jgi:FkbM family methyltransferase
MSNLNKRLVYTALIGDYEEFSEIPLELGPNTDLICFTDNPDLKSDIWKVRVVTPRFMNDPIRSARYLKIMGPSLLQDYDESLWIDNTVRITQPVDLIFNTFLNEVDLCLPFHSYRESVAAEFSAVDLAGYDDTSRIYEQLIHYSQSRMDVLDEKPFWTAILLRKHSDQVKDLMHRWWDHILRYSRRDQLSLNYVLREVNLEFNALNIDNSRSDFHQWPIATKRNSKKTQGSTVLDSFRMIPIARIGKLQNEVNALKRSLDKQKAPVPANINKNVTNFNEPALFTSLFKTLVERKPVKVVQVGVCDGVINDPIYDIVTQYKDKTEIVLIEPQTFLIPIIKENYREHPAHHVINCAIGELGQLTMYRLKEGLTDLLQRTYMKNAPSYRVPAGFVSSSYEHVVKHIQGKLPSDVKISDAIEDFSVESKDLKAVLDEVQWQEVDVLQVDTEGMDDITLSFCNLETIKPFLINFEHFHLSTERYGILCEYLVALGYKVYRYSQSDTLASIVDLGL